ncbi:hypothetical protein AC249_AIPGENE19189, partial [Exaiptasia diaphana]
PYVKFHLSCLGTSNQVPKTWYCPTCRLLPEFKRSTPKTRNLEMEDVYKRALNLDSICMCDSKAKSGDRLIECHTKYCTNGKFFHLDCLNYKRMPKNSRSTWICSGCKKNPQKANAKPPSEASTSTTSYTSLTPQGLTCSVADNDSDNDGSDHDDDGDYTDNDDDDDVQVVKVTKDIFQFTCKL